MLALGLILLIVGIVIVAIATVGQPPSAAPLAPLGWLLAIVGLILALVAVLVVGDDVNAAVVGVAAMGIIPPAPHAIPLHEDPPEPVAGSTSDREPVIVAFIVGAVPLLIAAISGVADLFAAVPNWLVPLATIVGTLTTGLAALWARGRVTPTALPKLDDDTPLVPMVQREEP